MRPIGQQSVVQQKPKERKPVASDRTVKEVRILSEIYSMIYVIQVHTYVPYVRMYVYVLVCTYVRT